MDDTTRAALHEHFNQLPRVLQEAITSADIEKELRTLSEGHKLHLDQWQRLEDEVMLVLFGLTPVTELQANIQSKVGTTTEEAQTITADIMRIVFEPIRAQLERELGAPQAKEEGLSDMEKVREQALAQEKAVASVEAVAPVAPAVQTTPQASAPATPLPATPPMPPPTDKVARSPASGAYKPGETSVARVDVHDDPYRETPA